MSPTALGVVATGNQFALPSAAGFIADDPLTLFTFGPTQTVRVDAVYIHIDYLDEAATGDIYQLNLLAQNGDLIAAIPTPKYTFDSQAQLFLTWMRGGNDVPVFGQFQQTFDGSIPNAAWGTFALPDLYLPGQSMITLNSYRGNDSNASEATIDVVNVTYTQGQETSGASVTVDITPYLLPAATS